MECVGFGILWVVCSKRWCFLTGYDAALYSAASSFYNQKQQTVTNVPSNWVKKDVGVNIFANRKPGGGGRGAFTGGGFRRKAPNLNPVQSLYCEVCKISCAGPQVMFFYLLVCQLAAGAVGVVLSL